MTENSVREAAGTNEVPVRAKRFGRRPKPSLALENDPDLFLLTAKRIVVRNYNEHRNPKHIPNPLRMSEVSIMWFSKNDKSWQAVLGSEFVQGLFWEVSYKDTDPEIHLEVYKKLNTIRIPLEEKTA